jgi:hypothetical protein
VIKTVFISSTFQDLSEHRRAVWQVLEGFNANVRGMEQFGARPEAALQTCLAEVEQSDVYVGIIAFRLGSVDAASGKSFTQLEYEHARQIGKDILIYLADEQSAKVRYVDVEVDPQQRERLNAFKATLKERHTVATFSSAEDLAEKLKRDFSKQLQPKEPETTESDAEFDKTLAIVKRFMLLPKVVSGREIRLRVAFNSGVFPAARGLCKAFNLQYGNTVGSCMNVRHPTGSDMRHFREVYASAHNVDSFLELVESKEPVDLYARLQFSEEDVPATQAQFFGESYYGEPDYGDPDEHYVAPDGRVILLFSKRPKNAV